MFYVMGITTLLLPCFRKYDGKARDMTWQVKALADKPDDVSLTLLKERTDCCLLSSDLHNCVHVYTSPDTRNVNKCKKRS